MCGIVGAIAERNVEQILLEGLRRLEYRGYDSAGLALVTDGGSIERRRAVGKVASLTEAMEANPVQGHLGIAHTRWATHGVPSEANAHPHLSREEVAIVHNGIIENYESLREKLKAAGYTFSSQTDTEVIVNLVHQKLQTHSTILEAVKASLPELEGAYAFCVVNKGNLDEMVVARLGSPLVIGMGIGEHFVASDVHALLPVTQRFIFLEEGDVGHITRTEVKIWDADGNAVEREVRESSLSANATDRGTYRHFMLKEIHEQPVSVADTLEGRISRKQVLETAFGPGAKELFDQVQRVRIIACGTSFHAGMTARYWFESLAGIPCEVEVASEYRYRHPVVTDGTLFVTISQSGETADTLAALRLAKATNYVGSLCICNVPESSLVRESDLVLMTHAGPEIGVASTKAFTTQLVGLLLLVISLGRRKNLSAEKETELVTALQTLPRLMEQVLALDSTIKTLSEQFADLQHALFLGRGSMYPVAMEGALKLKEISYIHAEAYPAGELKHGPLALVDNTMPVITVAPNDELLEKLKSNLQEVRARGGKLFVFADQDSNFSAEEDVEVVHMPSVHEVLTPILYTLPLQLLSYHVAVLKGTDVDQPRNLAKSVTVE